MLKEEFTDENGSCLSVMVWLHADAAVVQCSWTPLWSVSRRDRVISTESLKGSPGIVLVRSTNGIYHPSSSRLLSRLGVPASVPYQTLKHIQKPSLLFMFTFTEVSVNTSWVLLRTERQLWVTHTTLRQRSRVTNQWFCVSVDPIKVLEFSRKSWISLL